MHTGSQTASGTEVRGQQGLQRGCQERILPELHPGVCQGVVGPLCPDPAHGDRLQRQGVQPRHAQTLLQVQDRVRGDCHVPLAHSTADHGWSGLVSRQSANLIQKHAHTMHKVRIFIYFIIVFDHTKINRKFKFFYAATLMIFINHLIFTPIMIDGVFVHQPC